LKAELEGPRTLANWLIYASIILGVALVVQLNSLGVPSWLFYSVLAGWIAYLTVGIAVTLRVSIAYPVSLILAVLTLAVSLPQPEHYSFGVSPASLTFIAGSILQIGVILAVGRYLILKSRVRNLNSPTHSDQ
jgi:hypothetical protein